MVTQASPSDMSKPHVDQLNKHLCFLSAQFRGAELRWLTIEKEEYATMANVQWMHWLLATSDGFDLFTDHNNLIFLFEPLAVVTDLSQSSLRKVFRWEARLSLYNYTFVQIFKGPRQAFLWLYGPFHGDMWVKSAVGWNNCWNKERNTALAEGLKIANAHNIRTALNGALQQYYELSLSSFLLMVQQWWQGSQVPL